MNDVVARAESVSRQKARCLPRALTKESADLPAVLRRVGVAVRDRGEWPKLLVVGGASAAILALGCGGKTTSDHGPRWLGEAGPSSHDSAAGASATASAGSAGDGSVAGQAGQGGEAGVEAGAGGAAGTTGGQGGTAGADDQEYVSLDPAYCLGLIGPPFTTAHLPCALLHSFDASAP